MANIIFDKYAFIQSMRPGLESYIVQAFADKLQARFDDIIQQVYNELLAEMPNNITCEINRFFDLSRYEDADQVHITVKLEGVDAMLEARKEK